MTLTHDEIMARVAQLQAAGDTAPRAALDAVNEPMIRHWAEAMGDTDPRWRGPDAVAPPAMAQVWTMYGLDPHRPADDPLHATMRMLDEAGFSSVLGTNCDQTYARFLRLGERPEITTRLHSVVGPKQTGVGEGYFVTTESVWTVAGAPVATMTFRVLKFKPGTGRPAVDRSRGVRPVINSDNAYFFEGAAVGELRIQRCAACGELRHPPGPVCPSCHAMDRGCVVASGRGRVVSYVVHHAPQLPGRVLPLTVVLVELAEGVRMVGAYVGNEPTVGDEVHAVFDRVDDDLTLVAWESSADSAGTSADSAGSSAVSAVVEVRGASATSLETTIPAWSIAITATLIVSAAIATRDFQDVHHDRDLAVQRGSKDIFPNILTTTGLVQRYLGDWVRATGRAPVRITGCALRLGAPAYAGDTLTLAGHNLRETEDGGSVDVIGTCALGNHVTAQLTWERA